ELERAWQQALRTAYVELSDRGVKLLLTTYFGRLGENAALAASLPVAGLHVDAVNGREDVLPLVERLGRDTVL
ncbi:hypothetical protein, partial [Enterobacter asburiae]|uniref:hypothetical protein n=1 Tax=Enterobacter asburiae TaxID=61645 RepID=UPI0013D75D00